VLGNKDAAANIAVTYQITFISSNSKAIDRKRCLTFSYDKEKMKAKR
jgi:hypothetical protein